MTTLAEAAKAYRGKGYTCAESVFLAANDVWNLGFTEDISPIMAGFGGGMHCGEVCGAISGGIAAMGLKYCSGNGHNSPLLSIKCNLFVTTVKERAGSCRCDELGPKYRTLEEDCDPTVVMIAKILEEIDALELDIPEIVDYDLRNPPAGKPGFNQLFTDAKEKLAANTDLALHTRQDLVKGDQQMA
ncbi:MAG: C-GCAxxG-C-C family protein [Atopobiaceae bacterium]